MNFNKIFKSGVEKQPQKKTLVLQTKYWRENAKMFDISLTQMGDNSTEEPFNSDIPYRFGLNTTSLVIINNKIYIKVDKVNKTTFYEVRQSFVNYLKDTYNESYLIMAQWILKQLYSEVY